MPAPTSIEEPDFPESGNPLANPTARRPAGEKGSGRPSTCASPPATGGRPKRTSAASSDSSSGAKATSPPASSSTTSPGASVRGWINADAQAHYEEGIQASFAFYESYADDFAEHVNSQEAADYMQRNLGGVR